MTTSSLSQMDSHFSSSLFLWLLIVEFLVFIKIPSCSSTVDWYTKCSNNFTCGSLTATYPFWGNSRPSGCGIPELELTCDSDTATITIKGVKYRVLEIRSAARIIRIAREDFLDGICHPLFVNTSLDPPLLDYVGGYGNITFVYGCLNPPVSVTVPGTFHCVVSGAADGSGYIFPGAIGAALCYNSVYFPFTIATLSFILIQTALDDAIRKGFEVEWNVVDSNACSNCTSSKGVCGYDLNSKETTCYCPNQSNGLKICPASTVADSADPGKRSGAKFAIGFSAGGIILVCVLLGCCFLVVRKRRRVRNAKQNEEVKVRNAKQNEEVIKTLIMSHHSLMPKEYSYSEIKKMTDTFANKLGQGGFGGVYKGQLLSGQLVAVKVLHKSESEAEGFINEVASIGRTSHVNVVTLLGYCLDRKKALVYQYMPKGSLDKFIYLQDSERMECHLGCNVLYDIALGIARGLEYLHRGCNTRIVHLDIKPHNILLDEDFCPKIADFGLAKLCKGKESKVSMLGASGTVGYIAPEVFNRGFGQVSHKADVYSYGMMILEMVGGRKNFDNGFSHTSEKYFPDWIYQQLEQGDVSKFSGGITSDEEEIARKMTLVGLWCIQTYPSERPSMTKVIDMLEGSPRSLQIPPKPYLHSPARSPHQYSSTTSVVPYASSQKDEEDAPLQVVELQPT